MSEDWTDERKAYEQWAREEIWEPRIAATALCDTLAPFVPWVDATTQEQP